MEERIGASRKAGVSGRLYDQMKSLTQIRAEDPEGGGKQAVQAGRGVLRQLARAMNTFFRRGTAGETPGFPRFKPWQRFPCVAMADPRPGMVQCRGTHYRLKLKGGPVVKIRPRRTLPDSQQLKALRFVRRPTGWTVDRV